MNKKLCLTAETRTMSQIALIDDDFGMRRLAEFLELAGHSVEHIQAAKDVLANVDGYASKDAVILDLMMKRPAALSESETHGGYRTGAAILRELRKRNPHLPVLVLTSSEDSEILSWLASQDSVVLFRKPTPAEAIEKAINEMTNQHDSTAAKPCRTFIVHGHDDTAKWELKNYLQNTLGLPEPTILHEQPSLGRTIIEKFEHHASVSELVFVLLTPDDRLAPADGTNEEKRRSRQNVIFEMGYFLGQLGRTSGRVLLLHKGPVELPSDISGLIYIDISNGISAAGESIRKEVASVITP